MHLGRSLMQGIAVFREGRVPVKVERDRNRLLAVRNGQLSWKEFHAWRGELIEEFEVAWKATRLPELPDRGRAEAFLLKARKSVLE